MTTSAPFPSSSPSTTVPGWLGRVRPPTFLRHAASDFARNLGRPFDHRPVIWVTAAVLVGAVPLLLALPLHTPMHQAVTGLLAQGLLLGAIARRRWRAGMAAVLLVFAAHCAVGIAAARFAPDLASAVMPGGLEYWQKQVVWIQSGIDPEYEPWNWVPAHLQLAAAVMALGYVSLGLIPFIHGFYEVDLMNFYVGRLLAHSDDAMTSLLFGWHPWSVIRGFAYAFLVYETAAASYRRFTGHTGLRGDARAWGRRRLMFGLALVVLDGMVKLAMLEPVRAQLAANFVSG